MEGEQLEMHFNQCPKWIIFYYLFLSGESHGQRSLVGYSPWGRIEPDMTERLTHTQIWFMVSLYLAQSATFCPTA